MTPTRPFPSPEPPLGAGFGLLPEAVVRLEGAVVPGSASCGWNQVEEMWPGAKVRCSAGASYVWACEDVSADMMMNVWEQVGAFGAFEGVGGAGFSKDGALAVVRTSDGVFYVRSDDGLVISSYGGSSMDERFVDGFRGIRVLGIGGEEEEISLAGYWGGGLRRMTDDGWIVEWRSVGDRLEALLAVEGEDGELMPERHRIGRLEIGEYLPGAGFSPCGRYLMFVTFWYVHVWKRCKGQERVDAGR